MRVALVALLVLLAGCTVPQDAPIPIREDPSASPKASPSPTAGPTPGDPPRFPTSATPTALPGHPPRGRFTGCSGAGHVPFSVSPMRDEDFRMIIPYGLVVGAHVTPIDHMYFSPPHGSVRDAFEVRAIADGVIYEIGARDVNVDTGQARAREWRLDIAHTCTFTSYFDLITSLEPSIEAEYNRTRGGRDAPWSGIPVKAGQVVGRIGAQTLDFGAYDYNVTLPGLIVPSHYDREPWKVHMVDPFPHFDEPLRSMLLAKVVRKVEPRAGKIDHDVDGRLIGNWFQVGTNAYAGADPARYWTGHLAVVPDHLDPTQIRFSVGDFGGAARQFGVKGNAPWPGNVSTETGVVEYELVQFEHYARNDPSRVGFGPSGLRASDDPAARNLERVAGVALVQLTGARTLKVEVFPGRAAAEVEGFTPAAREYER